MERVILDPCGKKEMKEGEEKGRWKEKKWEKVWKGGRKKEIWEHKKSEMQGKNIWETEKAICC
jgi:hypothetical protein